MSCEVLIDASALVALLNRREAHHPWASQLIDQFEPPWSTCEPVLTDRALAADREVSPLAAIGTAAGEAGIIPPGANERVVNRLPVIL